MKRTKLITNLCLLILSLACLTFGVYSAVKTSFTASGTITFNAYNVECLLDVTISGIEAGEGTTTDSTTHLSSKTLKLSTFTKSGVTDGYTQVTNAGTVDLGVLKFDELNTVLTDEQRSTITISIALKNYSKFMVTFYASVESSVKNDKIYASCSRRTIALKSNGTDAEDSDGSLVVTLKGKDTFNAKCNIATFTIEPETAVALEDGVNCTISDGVLQTVSLDSNIKSIVIPKNVVIIGNGAFSYLHNFIQNVFICEGVTTINSFPERISPGLPSSIKVIGCLLFHWANTSVSFSGTIDQWKSISDFQDSFELYGDEESGCMWTIYCADGVVKLTKYLDGTYEIS